MSINPFAALRSLMDRYWNWRYPLPSRAEIRLAVLREHDAAFDAITRDLLWKGEARRRRFNAITNRGR